MLLYFAIIYNKNIRKSEKPRLLGCRDFSYAYKRKELGVLHFHVALLNASIMLSQLSDQFKHFQSFSKTGMYSIGALTFTVLSPANSSPVLVSFQLPFGR